MSIMKDSARRKLEIALEFNKLADYITGDPLFAIKVSDGAGGRVKSTMYPMEAIYDMHREHPELELDRKFYAELNTCFMRDHNPIALYNGVQAIVYQMRAECSDNAAFYVDCLGLLATVRKSIAENRALYQRWSTAVYEEFKDIPEQSMLQLLEEQQESIRGTVKNYRRYLQESRG